MTWVTLELLSREGDRLGHLVRGVQMLRSYGQEFVLHGNSDVWQSGAEPPALHCRLDAETACEREPFAGILRETAWALGDTALQLRLLKWGDGAPLGDQAGEAVFMKAEEFEEICRWGQQLSGQKAPVQGEWLGEPGLG